ncbi:AraC family transcriptional regulator, partial [Nonomuraea aridisoli]
HLAQVRLRHALTLLETTALPIAEIAARTGYYDQSALTRHLKAAHGVTPAAVRR